MDRILGFTGEANGGVLQYSVPRAERIVQHGMEELRAGGIDITALHSHMLDEEPRLFFMHFFANDDAMKLALALRRARSHEYAALTGMLRGTLEIRMKRGRTLFLLVVGGFASMGCATADQPVQAVNSKETVLFMCPYGGAKSVIAASYFNRLAEADGLPYVATAAAAETPYEAVPKPVAEFLEQDGFAVATFKPRQVAAADLESAAKVVSIDCDLAKLDTRRATVEQWNDVPKVSVDLPASAAAIRAHVEKLVSELKTKRP